MSRAGLDQEMRSRFEASERISVGESSLARPALRASADSLRAHFAGRGDRAPLPLENPHLEPKVTDSQRASAVPAAVLITIVLRDSEPTLLVTQRHPDISFPGHWVLPGGRSDPGDATPVDTALREAREEVGLATDRLEVLGQLGEYVSHSGFRITPAVALAHPPLDLVARPGEVDAIAEIALSRVLDSASYFLYRFPDRRERAHFALDADSEGILLTGVTASLCIGLYSQLLGTHTTPP